MLLSRTASLLIVTAVLCACGTTPSADDESASAVASHPAIAQASADATMPDAPAPEPEPAPDPAPEPQPEPKPTTGTIRGRVMLRAGEPLPEPARIDVRSDAWLAEILPDGFDDPSRVVNADRTVPHVFVYMSGASRSGAHWPDAEGEIEMRVPDARFEPRVLGVRAGQTLRIRNDAQITHCFRSKPRRNTGGKKSVAPGGSAAFVFQKKEKAVPLSDDVYSWMSGFVFVLDHPYFATTAGDGTFVIEDVPAGLQDFRAWHELHGELRTKVDVPAGGVIDVVLELPPLR